MPFFRLQTPGLPADSVVDLGEPAPSLRRSLLASRIAQGAFAAFACAILLWQLSSYSTLVTPASPADEPSVTPNPPSPIPANPSTLETPAPSSRVSANPSIAETPSRSSPVPANPSSPDTPARSSPVPASRRLVFEMVLSEAQGNFRVGKVDLPNSAKQRIDQMVTKLKDDPKGLFIEIEGHTDNVGSTSSNAKLAKERAEAVKRYLYEAHRVPLDRINAISYGEEKPVAPNNTRQSRAKNRRIVIKVLA